MTEKASIRSHFLWYKWAIPVILGIGAASGMLWWSLDQLVLDPATQQATTSRALLASFEWTGRASWALFATLGCIALRDFAYILRLRILSFRQFNWKQSFDQIMLWELASALTPSVVGGSAIAILVLKRGGMSGGQSVATVFVTAMLDELFYLIAVPVFLLVSLSTGHFIFPQIEDSTFGDSIPWLFALAYAFIAVLTAIIFTGILYSPERSHRWLNRVSNWNILSRWGTRLKRWSDDLLQTSHSMRSQPRLFWSKALATTILSWSARFLTLNMILLIFFETIPHAAVLARQLVLWLVMTISPTPGSSGFAEVALPAFLGDLIGFGYLAAVALIWRFATYFLYLFIGAWVLPRWLSKTSSKIEA
ncbi:MAG: lysylphosphatidylglycerol synthase transmembrane domain-containing protein [Flavobacteriales bacterium]|nr:lysylphosphatidylglycerol synthase transmembrane domain-containing protein [Flavobacteriales bacterium]